MICAAPVRRGFQCASRVVHPHEDASVALVWRLGLILFGFAVATLVAALSHAPSANAQEARAATQRTAASDPDTAYETAPRVRSTTGHSLYDQEPEGEPQHGRRRRWVEKEQPHCHHDGGRPHHAQSVVGTEGTHRSAAPPADGACLAADGCLHQYVVSGRHAQQRA